MQSRFPPPPSLLWCLTNAIGHAHYVTSFAALYHFTFPPISSSHYILMYRCAHLHMDTDKQTCTDMHTHESVCMYVWGLTFLYICQMSWYWIGKITKRRGFSRSKGSNEGSKGAATLSIIVRVSLVLLSLSSVVTDILRTLLMFSVRIFLLGLYTEKQKTTYK